ncbi:MAG: 3'(2'),5'-bisphosphate nucleotidase CysQ [Candidatus Jettenia sp. CY-1]|nr:MAG: 3'(2'),5'-bisphosphate nucleotidase CysQ [Candidatus Jettenia sp. CY-1]
MNNDKYAQNLIAALLAAKEAGDAILEVYNSNFSVEKKEDNSPLTIADKRSHEIIAKHVSQLTNQKAYITGHILSEEGKDIPYEERKNWEYFWLIDPLDGTKEFIKRNGEFTVNIALIHNGKPVLGIIYAPVLKVFYFAAEDIGAYKLSDYDDVAHGQKINIANRESIEILKKISQKLPVIKRSPSFTNNTLPITIVASRSHLSKETEDYIHAVKQEYGEMELVTIGSSLKFCLIAEGKANIYPRFGPTMEWDTAAGQAIIEGAGGKVMEFQTDMSLNYNKESLVNPWFIVFSKNNYELHEKNR